MNSKDKAQVTVALAGSKSLTNRALILAALAQGESELRNPSLSDDTIVLKNALEKFGVGFSYRDRVLRVTPPTVLTPYRGEIDLGPAGTSMRFLTAFAAAVKNSQVVLSGSERMHQRPIGDLINPLSEAGFAVRSINDNGCPPLEIKGIDKKMALSVTVSTAVSSQYLTALLLSASNLSAYTEIKLAPGAVVSQSYIDLTLTLLRSFGVNAISEGGNYFLIAQTRPQATKLLIEGDATGAGYFWTAAVALQQTVVTKNLPADSTQGDLAVLDILERSGAVVDRSLTNAVAVSGLSGELKPINADLKQLPDSAQTLAVLAALIPGRSELTGLETLKHKETDRLLALQQELAKIGIKCEVSADSIVIHGRSKPEITGAVAIDTYDDHRMAMSFAVLTKLYPQVRINQPEVVSKSFPDFWLQFDKFSAQF